MVDRIEKTVELRAPVERVWRAITDHNEFGEWFRVKLEAPFVPGEPARGRVTHPGYEHVAWEARVVTMDPPRLFAFTWHPYAVDPAVDYAKEPETLVEFHLTPTPAGTHLVIVESGFEALPAARQADALRMNGGGWEQQTVNIKTYVES